MDSLDLEEPEDEETSGLMTLTLVKVTTLLIHPLSHTHTHTHTQNTRPMEFVEGFTLQGALDEGYFTDLTVTSSDGSGFKVHRTVLGHTLPSMSCRDWEMFLATLKGGLVRVLLW